MTAEVMAMVVATFRTNNCLEINVTNFFHKDEWDEWDLVKVSCENFIYAKCPTIFGFDQITCIETAVQFYAQTHNICIFIHIYICIKASKMEQGKIFVKMWVGQYGENKL